MEQKAKKQTKPRKAPRWVREWEDAFMKDFEDRMDDLEMNTTNTGGAF